MALQRAISFSGEKPKSVLDWKIIRIDREFLKKLSLKAPKN